MSDNARDRHAEAVGFANLQVEEMEAIIHSASEALDDQVLPAIMNAVGDRPDSEAGNNAYNFASNLRIALEAALGVCEAIKGELNDYSQGL